MPELHILAGPNGSGKSTFTRQVLDGTRIVDYTIPRVINPDVIAKRLNPGHPDKAAIAAGREALRERESALARRESFAIETTLSGKGELDLIRMAGDAGYTITMTFVSVMSAKQAAARVAARAREENRTVAIDIIIRRFPRTMANLAALTPQLDRIDVYDNSSTTLVQVARLERGRIVSLPGRTPAWAERVLREPVEVFRDREIVAREAMRKIEGKRIVDPARNIREDDVSSRTLITGRVLVISDKHVAIATSARSYAILDAGALNRSVAIDERVHLALRDGRAIVQDVRKPARERDR